MLIHRDGLYQFFKYVANGRETEVAFDIVFSLDFFAKSGIADKFLSGDSEIGCHAVDYMVAFRVDS